MTRLYRALLHLYPASFRREYGKEMTAVFAARWRDAEGIPASIGLLLSAVFEVLGNATLVHFDILRQDLAHLRRSWSRTPAFALTAVCVTALGIGANAAAFAVADFALIRPLPYPDADRLVALWQRPPGYDQMELSPANYRDWREMASSFETMGAFNNVAANLVGLDQPERVEGAWVEPTLLQVLGIPPALGRGFTAADAEPGAPGTVILSDPFWRARFAADPGVLGRVIHLDGGAYEVIGVLSPALRFPRPSTQFWIPLLLPEEVYLDRGNNYLEVVATLRPGTTIEAARADLDVVTRRLAALYPDANRDTGATVERLRDQITERSRLLLLALVGASLCILIIACANLGSLLIARGLARERELAVRAALGAGRERLVRQLVTESLVLAGGGGVLGVLVAGFSLPLLSRLVPPSLPLPGAPSIDLRVIGFAALLTVLTCLLFTVLPARRASSGLRFAVLRDGRTAGRSSRLRAALVAVEIAASVVLLVSAGLLMRAIQRVQAVDPGFRTENLLTVRTPLASPAYDSTNRRVAFYRRVVDEVRALPGVIHAAYVTSVPLLWGGGIWPVVVNGEAEIRAAANSASMRFVTPGYFGAMDIPLRQGRDVAQQDRLESPSVAVVSQSFVDRYWPGEPALGKRFRMAFAEREIVGVVADIRVRGLERGNEPQVYMPAAQIPGGGLPFYWPRDLVIHTEAGAMPSLAELERIVHAVDGDVPLASFQTMAEIVGDQTASRSVQLRVLGALAAVALLLAVVGIHGLLAFMVAERTPEIGVRIALGAGSRSVVSMVVGRALALAAVGLVPGVWVAYLAGRSMESALFGVTASDRLTFALVIVLCLAAALFGALAPALRAVRVDPIRALKSD